MADGLRGVGHYRTPKKDSPARSRAVGKAESGGAYSRCQVCARQMKAMQPDTSSFWPPACSSILDL